MPLMMPKDFFERRITAFLRYRKFSPVKRYLENLPELTPSDWKDWGRLAETLFGATDHLSQVKLSRWLIAAVARVYQPGCKADSALVIQGSQGIGKTSFLAALFGEYFQTLHSHMGTLEQQRILQRAWGCELGELEATFRVKDISALKAFLTETSDTYRDLYQNSPEKHPRHCVFAGTTNETAFLNDPTGSRRFWIVPVGDHQIPVDWVSANRDRIWAVAKYLYLEGEQWWLTEEESALSEQTNKAFRTESSFEEPLRLALDILEELGEIAIAASDAMTYLLGIKPENHRKYSRELASVMTTLGYERKNFASKKLKGWHYVRPEVSEPIRFEPYMVDRIAERRNSPQSDRRR
jgi:predicted P-loop ATPase